MRSDFVKESPIPRSRLQKKGVDSGVACLKIAKGVGSMRLRLQESTHLYFDKEGKEKDEANVLGAGASSLNSWQVSESV